LKTSKGSKILPKQLDHDIDEHRGKRILLVDDNATNLAILQRQMENWKLVPMMASSGSEAMEILFDDPKIDMVITDMQMPEMDGIAFAINVQRYAPQIPIILLSSVGEDIQDQHRQLFTSILTKPIRQHVLSSHIMNALQTKLLTKTEVTVTNKLSTDFSKNHPFQLLVAEDNPINQHVIVRILQKLGYEPDLVSDGQEAVEFANQKNYGLILMDMQMPVMDGLQATRVIRKTVVEQPVIVALTANAMEGIQQQCFDAGMDDYISKPIKLEELMAVIRKWSIKV
jgi:CheY-like chemotaxis protein